MLRKIDDLQLRKIGDCKLLLTAGRLFKW